MRGGLVPGGEDAGALERDLDAHRLVRQLGRIALGGHLDRTGADVDGVAFDRHLAGEAAVYAVETHQMGVGLDRAEIVDGDDLDVLAAALDDGAQHVAADASETVDRDLDCHVLLPRMNGPHRLAGLVRPMQGLYAEAMRRQRCERHRCCSEGNAVKQSCGTVMNARLVERSIARRHQAAMLSTWDQERH